MAFNIEIPKELAHLKIDDRGYPIPFFVTWIDGKPEFRYIDIHRQRMILDKKICGVCGVKLPKDYVYFVSGPLGMKNQVSTDSAMHKVCADFSVMACPHLHFKKAERRQNDDLGKHINAKPSLVTPDKANEVYVVRASKWWVIEVNRQPLVRYRFDSFEKYTYIDNKLTKEHSNEKSN